MRDSKHTATAHSARKERKTRGLVIVGTTLLLMGVVAVANADRAIFVDLAPDPATVELERVVDAPETLVTDRVIRSESLDAVRDQGLLPFQWPWFADGVSTPEDAVAGATDLVGAISSVPDLSDLKVLSAERRVLPGGVDLDFRFAWIKLNDNELIRIGTQLLDGDTPPLAEGRAVVGYGADGEATIGGKPGAIHTTLVLGNRMAFVDLQAIDPEFPLSLTADDLLRIGESILRNLG